MKKNKVIISAGGTGGHLIPAQQLAKKLLSEEEVSVFFMAKGLEKNRNFRKDVFDYKDIAGGPVSLKKAVVSLFLIAFGTIQSLVQILKIKGDIIVGFGSYHTFPVLLAAYLLRKPIVIFEANSTLGKVNRFFSKKAKAVAAQFDLQGQKMYDNSVPVPFLPWISSKEKIDKTEALAKLNLKTDVFTFLVFGGSLGASFINETFLMAAKNLKEKISFQVIHICGNETKVSEIKDFYEKLNINAHVSAYEREMSVIYSAADMAICRCGAATISELIFFGVPSILIPYLLASENHQELNAFYMRDKVHGARVFSQNSFDFEGFERFLLEVAFPGSKKLLEMKNNLCNFKELLKKENRKDLSKIICEVLQKL